MSAILKRCFEAYISIISTMKWSLFILLIWLLNFDKLSCSIWWRVSTYRLYPHKWQDSTCEPKNEKVVQKKHFPWNKSNQNHRPEISENSLLPIYNENPCWKRGGFLSFKDPRKPPGTRRKPWSARYPLGGPVSGSACDGNRGWWYGMFPKIVGEIPPNHPMFNRVFHYFNHPILGETPLFWETPIWGVSLCCNSSSAALDHLFFFLCFIPFVKQGHVCRFDEARRLMSKHVGKNNSKESITVSFVRMFCGYKLRFEVSTQYNDFCRSSVCLGWAFPHLLVSAGASKAKVLLDWCGWAFSENQKTYWGLFLQGVSAQVNPNNLGKPYFTNLHL